MEREKKILDDNFTRKEISVNSIGGYIFIFAFFTISLLICLSMIFWIIACLAGEIETSIYPSMAYPKPIYSFLSYVFLFFVLGIPTWIISLLISLSFDSIRNSKLIKLIVFINIILLFINFVFFNEEWFWFLGYTFD